MRLALLPWAEAAPPAESDLTARLAGEGFEVFAWSDPAGRTYEPHAHGHDESIFGVRGEIVFTVDGRAYPLRPGDRLMLPRGMTHSARVGAAGATYLIGQRR